MSDLEAAVLLDSDVVIDILKGQPQAAAWLQTVPDARLSISAIVWMEVLIGAKDKQDQQHLRQLLSPFFVFHLTPDDSRWAMEQLAAFRLSHGIGLTDCLIGALAARTQLPLYTRNIKHYAPLPDIKLIQPYS